MKLIFFIAGGIVLGEILKNGAGELILPFLVSYIAARIFRPVGAWLSKKCRIKEKAGCAVFAVMLCFALVYFAAVLSSELIAGLGELNGIGDAVSELSSAALGLFDSLPFHLFGDAERVRDAVVSCAGELLSYLGGALASLVGTVAKSLPSSMLSIFIGAASFVYLMADMDGVGEGITALIPEKHRSAIIRVFGGTSDAVFSYVKAYLGLGAVTFVMLFVGFLLLRVASPLGKAFIIAVVDALPLIGCGAVLLPWGIYKLAVGRTLYGVGIIALYVVIWAVRQVLEPRLLGRMMGINSFVMLAVIYLGWKVGGLSGVIILSAAVMAVKNIGEDRGTGDAVRRDDSLH